LIKNSDDVWLKKKTPDGKIVKSLYTSGKGIKRVYGVTTWKRSGMKHYCKVMDSWKPAFKRNHHDFKVLCRYWEKWIESKDGGRKFLLSDKHSKKTAYTVLATRTEEMVVAGDDDDDDVDVDDHEDFEYESDPKEDTIILSNWDRKRGGRGAWNNYKDSDDEEDCGGGDDGSVGGGSDDESIVDDDVGNEDGHEEDDVEESAEDEGLNEFGKTFEEEAQAVGMASGSSNSKKQKRPVQPPERMNMRPHQRSSTRAGWK